MDDKKKKIDLYLLSYILILIFFGIFFLFSKHDVGNDSSLSDWLINFSGGFVRRGIIGEISIFFSNIFSIELRDTIFLFQTIIFSTYYFLVYKFLKDILKRRFFLLAIFSPIFILHPVAEIEILGRKELFIFLIFLLYLFFDTEKKIVQIIFKIFLFPLAVLIWEPVIFFITYLIFIDLVIFKIKRIDKKFLLILFSYFFIFFTFLLIYLNPISADGFNLMKNFLKIKFDESCYMSCYFVGNQSQNSFFELLRENISKIKLSFILTYSWIIFIGFLPISILLKNTKFNDTFENIIIFSNFKNLFFPFLIIFLPSLILYLLMYDWARVVHVSYTFVLLTYFWMVKRNIIFINHQELSKNPINKISSKIFMLIFLVYCFGWNPKVVISDDIASKPIYATPYKFYKIFLKDKF